jgi:hypothetical protein
MEKTLTQTTSRMPLLNKKVQVLPIHRKGGFLPENHDGAFMFTGTKMRIAVPYNAQTQRLVDPFTNEERDWLETNPDLSFQKGDLSVHKKGGYLKKYHITLDKSGKILDLSDPHDFITYKILLANKELVAPTYEDRMKKGTYKFMMVDMDHQVQKTAKEAAFMENVWIEFGSIKNSVSKLGGVLKMYNAKFSTNLKIPANPSIEFLTSEVKKIIDENPNEFVKIVSDPTFGIKSFIQDANDAGVIVKIGKNKYAFVGEPDDNYTLDELVEILDPNGKNQEKYFKIKKQIEDTKK